MTDQSQTHQMIQGASDGPAWHLEAGLLLLNRFEIVERLGTGSHGAVYRAIDHELGRQVALKTLLQASPEHIVRFKHEFRSLTDLVDPHLVLLYELFTSPLPFFTMELVDGSTLRQYVSPDGVLNEARCRQAVTHLVLGLETLHRYGRLHRDVKPTNVLVRADGVTKLADFGLTRRMTGLDAREEEGGVAGTPAFMSPEQAADLPLTPASDFYSVGAVLYELLCGEHPFADLPMLAMMMAKQGGPPPPPSSVANHEVPRDLEDLAMALLERDPDRRPTAAQVLAWLDKESGDQEPGTREDGDQATRSNRGVRDGTDRPPSQEAPGSGATGSASQGRAPRARSTRDSSGRDAGAVDAWRSEGPLIGRSMESSLLRMSALARAKGRTTTAAIGFVHGPSGSGKSVLLDSFAADLLAEAGAGGPAVLRGRCYEREQVPFKGVDGLFDAVRQALGERRAAGRPVLAGSALARLFPVLLDFTAPHTPVNLDPIELRRAAFTQAAELVRELSEGQGLVIVLDDMQWCDLDSADLLVELLRRTALERTFTVLGYRDDNQTHEADARGRRAAAPATGVSSQREIDMLREVCARDGAAALDLPIRPLTLAEGAALARALGVPPARCEFVAAEAMGNPLFIHELSRFLRQSVAREQVPASTPAGVRAPLAGSAAGEVQISTASEQPDEQISLDALIITRVHALPPLEVCVLEYVCVAGRPIVLDAVLDAVSSGAAGHDAVARLRGQNLVRTRGSGIATEVDAYHDRIRAALLSTHGKDQGAALHLELARVLEKRQADAEILLFHYEGAGDLDRAAMLSLEVAKRADRALAFHRAAQLYGRARELLGDTHPDAAALAAAQAQALANDGRGAAAGRIFLQAAAMAEPSVARSLRRRAADQLLRSGRHQEGMVQLRRVLSELAVPLRENSVLSAIDLMIGRARVALRTRRGQASWLLQGRTPTDSTIASEDEAQPLTPHQEEGRGRTVEISQEEADRIERVDATFTAAINLSSVNLILGQDLQSRHLLAAMELGEPRRMLRALAMETLYSATSGELGRARTSGLIDNLAALSERAPDPYSRNMVELAIGVEEVYRGYFAQAYPRLLAVCTQLRLECTGVEWEIGTARTFALTAMFYLGHFHEMRKLCREAIDDAIDRDDLHAEIMTRMAYGVLVSLVQNDVARASDELASCIERGRGLITAATFEYIWMLTESRIHRFVGRPLAAQAAVESRWPALRRSMMLTKQPVRIYSYYERTLTALHAMQASSADQQASLLKLARTGAARLARERSIWGQPLADLLLASIASQEARDGDAVAHLIMAENRFRTLEMRALAAAARLRRAEVLAGVSERTTLNRGSERQRDEGERVEGQRAWQEPPSGRAAAPAHPSSPEWLRSSALDELIDLGVAAPLEFADVLAPPMRARL